MNIKIKRWIVGQYDKLESQRKKKFLHLLRLSPDVILHNIASLLPQLRLDYIILTGEATTCCDHQEEPKEILQELYDHFAKQLEVCISCPEESCTQVTEHCRFCDASLCADHIFLCKKCNAPMCRPCQTEFGKRLCRTCIATEQAFRSG